jgi:ABC-2 type transport system ATP-binding protein
MANPVLQVENLVKRYGEVEAVRGVSFSVEEGEVFGLLGPNGAGKTSTIEVLE